MTALEQSTASLIAAAERDDLAAIEEALIARLAALDELAAAGPTSGPVEASAAFETGEIACRALDALKSRLCVEGDHLALLQAFAHDLQIPPDPEIDCLA